MQGYVHIDAVKKKVKTIEKNRKSVSKRLQGGEQVQKTSNPSHCLETTELCLHHRAHSSPQGDEGGLHHLDFFSIVIHSL